MKITYVFLLTIVFLSSIDETKGQAFEAKLIGGLNASQLEGDNLSGFNKVGIHAGLGIIYPLPKNAVSVELLFNQKGSSAKANINTGTLRQNTNLNYVQIPILYHINSWYNEGEEYYQIDINAGLYAARLFGVSSSNLSIGNLTDQFKKQDIGLVIGANYRFSSTLSVGLRYDQSFVKIFKDTTGNIDGLISYLATLRLAYHL